MPGIPPITDHQVTLRSLDVCYVRLLRRDPLLVALQQHPEDRAIWIRSMKDHEKDFKKRMEKFEKGARRFRVTMLRVKRLLLQCCSAALAVGAFVPVACGE